MTDLRCAGSLWVSYTRILNAHVANYLLVKHKPLWIQLFRERLSKKNVHATIPKGNMGYDLYSVSDDFSCRTYFCCFLLALANTFPWPSVPILSNFFEKKRTQITHNAFQDCGVHLPDNLSRNSCIQISNTCLPEFLNILLYVEANPV